MMNFILGVIIGVVVGAFIFANILEWATVKGWTIYTLKESKHE